MKKLLIIAAAGLLSAAPAWACDCEVSVTGAFIRATNAANGAAFLTVTNKSDTADKLVAVKGDVAKVLELHTHVKDGDVMRMRKVESIIVPAHGKAELKPGGDHIMLLQLNGPLKEGDKVKLTLEFEKIEPQQVEIPVLGAGAMSGPAHHHDHHDAHHKK